MFDLERNSFELAQVFSGNLDPYRALDPCSEHVDPVANWRDPDIGEAGHLHGTIQFLDQHVGRHALAPFLARFEADGCLEHGERGGVGGGVGTAGLAEHGFDFRYGHDQPVGALEQRRRLAG